MPTMFYVVFLGALFIAMWITMQSITIPLLITDLFLIMFYGKMPTMVNGMILLANVIVLTGILYRLFAPKNAD